jgi:hypothetical protein
LPRRFLRGTAATKETKRNGSGIDQAKELRLALQYPEGASF